MGFATAAEIAAIVGAAASVAGSAYAATQSPPTPPGAYASSRQVALAQANALPYQRGLSAAEQQGGSALRFGYTQSTYSQQQRQQLASQISQLQGRLTDLQNAPTNMGPHGAPIDVTPRITNLQNRLSMLQSQYQQIPEGGGTVYLDRHGKIVPQDQAMANFQGYGTADVQGQLAQQFAHLQEDLGAKYGTQFAEEARHEAELADPQGFAARKAELDLINQGIDNPPPINPMAATLDQRMQDRLAAGSGLDSMSQEALDHAIQNANASRGGNGVSEGDVAQSLSTGTEGAARRQAAIQQAMQYVGSGVSPADVQYRREQQNLQNLGSFVAGRTPESQFANLSGAGGAGATPFYGGQQLPQLPQNAGAGGQGYALQNWLTGLRQQQGQVNGWTAGLSGILNGIGAMGQSVPQH